MRKLENNEKLNLDQRMNQRRSESYWYWDDTADRAIYARLLIRSAESEKAEKIISEMIR
jgi:hypothetical protein